jgi:nucleoside recognition membrane protein YjiH
LWSIIIYIMTTAVVINHNYKLVIIVAVIHNYIQNILDITPLFVSQGCTKAHKKGDNS